MNGENTSQSWDRLRQWEKISYFTYKSHSSLRSHCPFLKRDTVSASTQFTFSATLYIVIRARHSLIYVAPWWSSLAICVVAMRACIRTRDDYCSAGITLQNTKDRLISHANQLELEWKRSGSIPQRRSRRRRFLSAEELNAETLFLFWSVNGP